ncbi:MAG: Crp/Fnr family transcriptional regulator [Pseudomonadota bacterium]
MGARLKPPLPVFAPQTPFAGLSPMARAAMGESFIDRVYEPNAVIYLQHDDPEGLFLVISGHVRLANVLDDGSVLLTSVLGPGAVFGELPCFDGGLHQDAATALGRVRISVLTPPRLSRLRQAHPSVCDALGRHVADRSRAFVDVVTTMFLPSLAARLAQVLLRLTREVGTMTDSGVDIVPVITQSDLGAMARGSRENVNKLLKAWERGGFLQLKDRRISVLDIEELSRIAEEG